MDTDQCKLRGYLRAVQMRGIQRGRESYRIGVWLSSIQHKNLIPPPYRFVANSSQMTLT